MTGNQIKGKGFRGALRYNLEKVEKGMAEVLDHSFNQVNEKSIMREIQMVRILKPNLQKFFYHTSINFPPSEELPNKLMKQIAHDYLQASGFTQHQFILFRHYDAAHPHLHLLVNRIGYDGKVLSDSNDFARSEKILRQLESKYNLTSVISSTQATRRAVTKDEMEMMKRTNKPSHKTELQQIIKGIINTDNKLTCSEFIDALRRKGIDTRFNMASTGHVSGISYSYHGLVITGSKLGADFKWTTIKDLISYDQQRDQIAIIRSNARSKIHTNGPQSRTVNPRANLSPEHNASFNQASPNTALLTNLVWADAHSGLDPESALGLRRKGKRKKNPRR